MKLVAVHPEGDGETEIEIDISLDGEHWSTCRFLLDSGCATDFPSIRKSELEALMHNPVANKRDLRTIPGFKKEVQSKYGIDQIVHTVDGVPVYYRWTGDDGKPCIIHHMTQIVPNNHYTMLNHDFIFKTLKLNMVTPRLQNKM